MPKDPFRLSPADRFALVQEPSNMVDLQLVLEGLRRKAGIARSDARTAFQQARIIEARNRPAPRRMSST